MIKALLGPNGTGKSTYLRKLMGLESGKINLEMAMVFQEPLLFDLTVFENIALGLKARGIKEIKEKVTHWMKIFGISDLRNRRAITLSGGEAQKAALARAMAFDPKILLLDEPFANLDLPTQIELKNRLKQIIKEKSIETIWVTHNKSEALEIADYLMIMINGKIVQEGLPSEVIQKPETVEIASFLGIDNIFHGRIYKSSGHSIFENDKIKIETASVEKENAWIVIHPEDIILSTTPLPKTSARNSLAGIAEDITATGLTYRIKINAGEVFKVNITRISAEEMDIKPGSKLFLTFKAT